MYAPHEKGKAGQFVPPTPAERDLAAKTDFPRGWFSRDYMRDGTAIFDSEQAARRYAEEFNATKDADTPAVSVTPMLGGAGFAVGAPEPIVGRKATPEQVAANVAEYRRRRQADRSSQEEPEDPVREAWEAWSRAAGEDLDTAHPEHAQTPMPRIPQREQLRVAYASAANARPGFESSVREAAAAIGANVVIGPVKKPHRVLAKANADYGGDVASVRDVLRATVVVDTPEDAVRALDVLRRRFDAERVKDRFAQPTDLGYRDALVNVRLPGGLVAEVQINIPEIVAYKAGDGHSLYERAQRIERLLRDSPQDESLIAELESVRQRSRESYDAALEAARRRASAKNSASESRSSSARGSEPPATNERPSGESSQFPSPPPRNETLNAPSISQKRDLGGNEAGSGMVRGPGTPNDRAESAPYPSGDAARTPLRGDPGPGDGGLGGGSLPGGEGPADAGGVPQDRVDGGRAAPAPRQPGGRRGRAGAGEQSAPGQGEVADDDARPADDGAGSGGDAGGQAAAPAPERGDAGGVGVDPTTLPENERNHVIAPGDDVAPATDTAKFDANIAALTLLKRLEAEGDRQATPDEKKVLARYTGWGWGAAVFDEDKKATAAKRKQLKSLLTDGQYALARASTSNAHYTSETVVRPMWDLVRQLGFSGGRVLEPGAGTGNFFGMMPQDIAGASQLVGVELDDITGRILRKLYPQADVRIQGFQDTRIADNSFDLAIGNVPF